MLTARSARNTGLLASASAYQHAMATDITMSSCPETAGVTRLAARGLRCAEVAHLAVELREQRQLSGNFEPATLNQHQESVHDIRLGHVRVVLLLPGRQGDRERTQSDGVQIVDDGRANAGPIDG